MQFSRHWCMPNASTFKMKPIKELTERYISQFVSPVIVDPFARDSKYGTITNDLNPEYKTTYNLDAREFSKKVLDSSIKADLILFDPVYSTRQLSECYQNIGKKVTKFDTRSDFWSGIKDDLAKVTKKDGYAINYCWNSNGFGKKRGFEIIEIMLVACGGWHNDYIITVEKKIKD